MKVLTVTMEAALGNDIHTYAGGLGVLVGDKLRAARDMHKYVDVVTFSYPEGYVRNEVHDGKVVPMTDPYDPHREFKSEGEWEIKTKFGEAGVEILRGPNSWLVHTGLAPRLYVDTPEQRLKKEILLGKAAARIFAEGGYDVLHVEESQCAFAALELKRVSPNSRVVFTTHTPLPHGHEVWENGVVGRLYSSLGKIDMTKLALDNCDFVNCVSKMQREIMNPHLQGRAEYITNGVHKSWIHPNRGRAKKELIREINGSSYHAKEFDESFTIGIARRFASYKRMDLVLRQLKELEKIPVQVVFSGVAHPGDAEGIKTIEKVLDTANRTENVKVAYFPDYDMELAKKMIAGSDAWLNVPVEGKEASGTSWMKAMVNGTLLISTVSGSVPEFADESNALLIPKGSDDEQAKSLVQLIARASEGDSEMSKNARALAPELSARRMMKEYFSRAYAEKPPKK